MKIPKVYPRPEMFDGLYAKKRLAKVIKKVETAERLRKIKVYNGFDDKALAKWVKDRRGE